MVTRHRLPSFENHIARRPGIGSHADPGHFHFRSARKWLILGSVKAFGLILCGGLYAFDVNATRGMIGGAFIGLVMGLAFGGVERVATFLYGPKEPGE